MSALLMITSTSTTQPETKTKDQTHKETTISSAKAQLRPYWITKPWPSVPKHLLKLSTNSSTSTNCQILTSTTAPISIKIFQTNYEYNSRPGLFSNLMTDWASMTSRPWTLTHLSKRLGPSRSFQVGDDINGDTVSITLADYIRYEDSNTDRNPFIVFDSVIIECLNNETNELNHSSNYSSNHSPNSSPNHSINLKSDFTIPNIFKIDDFLNVLKQDIRPPYQWLLFGPINSGSPIHTDPMSTHAWNALISGAKHWVFFHPDTPSHLLTTNTLDVVQENQHDDDGSANDSKDIDRSDLWDDVYGWFHCQLDDIKQNVNDYFEQMAVEEKGTDNDNEQNQIVRCMECIQKPGEIIFVPSMWFHAVLNVKASIAVTQNYCSRTNINQVYNSMDDDELKHQFQRKMNEGKCMKWNDGTMQFDLIQMENYQQKQQQKSDGCK